MGGGGIRLFGGLEFVKGDCSLSVCNNLDTLIEVKGKFKLQSGKTNSLGKLRKVWGKCVLGDGLTELNSLGDLEYVGDELVITSPNIKSLGDLKYVGGKLRLRKSSVEDLGNLEFVGGSILIDRSASPNLIQQIKERNFKMTKG